MNDLTVSQTQKVSPLSASLALGYFFLSLLVILGFIGGLVYALSIIPYTDIVQRIGHFIAETYHWGVRQPMFLQIPIGILLGVIATPLLITAIMRLPVHLYQGTKLIIKTTFEFEKKLAEKIRFKAA